MSAWTQQVMELVGYNLKWVPFMSKTGGRIIHYKLVRLPIYKLNVMSQKGFMFIFI